MSLPLEPVLAHLERYLDCSIERWQALLRIPSVGTDPAHDGDTRRAAEWLVEQLRAIGFDAAARDTAGQPVVVGHHPGPGHGNGRRILYYGHYDVQPADPVDLWDTPPFEPTMIDGAHGPRMVALWPLLLLSRCPERDPAGAPSRQSRVSGAARWPGLRKDDADSACRAAVSRIAGPSTSSALRRSAAPSARTRARSRVR